jgi:acetoin:2,6-dichlorophenolindophenol oxidoreductase subunit alpha
MSATAVPSAAFGASELEAAYERMLTIRGFEERIQRLFLKGEVHGTTHLYNGQEAVAVGVGGLLNQDDLVSATYRGHGHAIAKGLDVFGLAAELMGRATGTCGGRAGSMNVIDLDKGLVGCFGIVGGTLAAATGTAFALRGTGRVAVAYFGDGTCNQAYFAECLNFAVVFRLPALFVCENNLYGEYTAQAGHQAIKDIADRGVAYGIPGVAVDGMDSLAMYEVAGEAIERARSGRGPSLIEAKTYRFYDHQGVTGMRIEYRSSDEEKQWRARDPVPALEQVLLKRRVMTKRSIAEVWEAARSEVATAIEFAEASPLPEPAQLLEDVYTEQT